MEFKFVGLLTVEEIATVGELVSTVTVKLVAAVFAFPAKSSVTEAGSAMITG